MHAIETPLDTGVAVWRGPMGYKKNGSQREKQSEDLHFGIHGIQSLGDGTKRNAVVRVDVKA